MNTWGERIKEAREAANLTQEQLGKKLGVTGVTIMRYEKNQRQPRLDQLGKIAKALDTTVSEMMGPNWDGWSTIDTTGAFKTEKAPTPESERKSLPDNLYSMDFSKFHQIPILGRISAGLPIYAEEHIEGYTLTDLNGGAEYFALRVQGDSMNAIGINDGYIIIVRRQEEVENGEIAVVMVGDEDATVKRFYATADTVTLLPQSTNPNHKPQIYDTKATNIKVLGKVKKVEFSV